HEEAPRLVGRGRRLAVIEVGRERDEPFLREAVRHVLNVRDEPPPLLDHDDGRAFARLRRREPPVALLPVDRERDFFTHVRAPPRLGRSDSVPASPAPYTPRSKCRLEPAACFGSSPSPSSSVRRRGHSRAPCCSTERTRAGRASRARCSPT